MKADALDVTPTVLLIHKSLVVLNVHSPGLRKKTTGSQVFKIGRRWLVITCLCRQHKLLSNVVTVFAFRASVVNSLGYQNPFSTKSYARKPN